MRLLCMLGLGCLLSNGVLGVHTELHERIYHLYRRSESRIEGLYEWPDELRKILSEIPEITTDNFFLVLHICAFSITREGFGDILESCLVLFENTKSIKLVRDCLYYFEEMFCIEDTHELNSIAAGYLKSRVRAMILFLNWNKARGKIADGKDEIIRIYQKCMKKYDRNPDAYGHYEENNGEDWCKAAYPEWQEWWLVRD